MYKIGMIGDRESVQGFLALGFSVAVADRPEAATEQLTAWVKEGSFAAIFLTEELAAHMADSLAQYRDLALPAITLIPGSRGGTGEGLSALRRAAERAVGADILFKEDESVQ